MAGKRTKAGGIPRADESSRPRRHAKGELDAATERAFLERVPRLTPLRALLRIAAIATVAIITWRAIHYRGATAGALLLPFATEIVIAVLIAPLLALVVREAEFRRETLGPLLGWLGVLVVVLIWQAAVADRNHVTFAAQLRGHADTLFVFARDHGMLWAMAAAGVGFLAAVVPDLIAYRKNGPPFVYIGSLNLGLRLFAMIVLGFWLMWAFDSNRRQRAEVLWFMLLAAEIFAMAIPWAVQRKLAQEKAQKGARKSTPVNALR
jgi:hypothetical protein